MATSLTQTSTAIQALLDQISGANLIVNEQCAIAQRQVAKTETTIANGSFAGDRLYIQHDGTNADYRVYEIGDSGAPASFPEGCSFCGSIKNNDGSPMGLALIDHTVQEVAQPLRSRSIVEYWSFLASTGTPTIKRDIADWTGTAGASGGTNFASGWSSNVPTIVTTDFATATTGSTSINASTWTDVGGVHSVGSSANAIRSTFYIEGLAAGATLYFTKRRMYVGSELPQWQPRSPSAEADACGAYCAILTGNIEGAEKITATQIALPVNQGLHRLRKSAAISHNLSWETSGPSSTGILAFGRESPGFVTISGALSMSSILGDCVMLTAATSFSGTIGHHFIVQIGSNGRIVFSAED